MVVEREREIRAFTAREYWTLEALLDDRGRRHRSRRTSPGSTARRSRSATARPPSATPPRIRALQPVVDSITTRQSKRNPAPPFTTSTLQQEASRKLGFSPKRTMSRRPGPVRGRRHARRPRRPHHLHADGLDRDRRRRHGRGAAGDRRALRRAVRHRQGPRLQDEGRRAPRRPTSRSGRPRSCATRSRCARTLKSDEYRLYRLIWQRAIASQMAPKELETTTAELVGGPVPAAGLGDADAVRRLLPRSTPRARTTPRPRRPSARSRRWPRATSTTVQSVTPDPALHRAAAPLHRGDPDQGARGARHRPPVDVRGDDLDDRRPRLRPGRGAPPPPRGDRRDRHRPPGRPLRRVRGPRVHGADGGGARRGRPRRARVGPAAARVLRRRSRRASTRSASELKRARLHDRGDRRGLLRGPPDGDPASAATGSSSPARTYPEHKETRPLPGRGGARSSRATARPARSAARAPSRRSAAGSGRSSAARATRTARTSSKDGPPPPDQLPFEVTCPKNADGHLVARRARRTGNVFWGCSAYPKCDFTTNDEPTGAVHDATDAPRRWPGRGRAPRRGGDVHDLRRRGRAARRATLAGLRLPGWTAQPGGARAAGAWRAARRRSWRRTGGGRRSTRASGGIGAGRDRIAARHRVSVAPASPVGAAAGPRRRDRPRGALRRFLRSLEARDPRPRRVARTRRR